MTIEALLNNYKDVVFNKYVQFDGRSGRKEYWHFFLVNLVIGLILAIPADVPALSSFYSLAVLLPSIGLGIRRLHDINKSGWLMLLAVIPVIGLIILLVLAAQEGDPGANRYGAPVEGAMPVHAETPFTPTEPPASEEHSSPPTGSEHSPQ